MRSKNDIQSGFIAKFGERALMAIGVVRSISELRGDAKQLGNESGLRDCSSFATHLTLPSRKVAVGTVKKSIEAVCFM